MPRLLVTAFATPVLVCAAIAASAAELPAPVRVGARIHGAFILNDDEPRNRFELTESRFEVELRPTAWLEAQIDLEAISGVTVKDAYLQVAATDSVSLRLGQFKKPFSRIGMMSSRRLPFWRRGIVTAHFVSSFDEVTYHPGSLSELDFGGRDRGLMASGVLGDLRWAVGAFNGSGRRAEVDSGKDMTTRITYRFSPALELGLSGALQYRNAPNVEWGRNDIWAAGLDAKTRLGIVDLVVEGLWGIDGTRKWGQHRAGGITYARVRIPLTETLQLRPIIKVELLDENLRGDKDLSFSLTAGANLRIGKGLRIMLQAEEIRGESAARAPQERVALLQIAFDQRVSLGRIEPRSSDL